MMTLNADVKSLNSLKILNIFHLQDEHTVSPEFITHVLSTVPHYLGQGVWLSDSPNGNLHSAIALATPKLPMSYQNLPVKILMTLSYADEQIELFLSNLNQLLQHQQIDTLLKIADAEAIASLLVSKDETPSAPSEGLTEEFITPNPHGLHTRPSAVLVSTIKQFDSKITVANLDGATIPVNGRSLMKIVSLGAKKGHRLQIHAEGLDAAEAMSAIAKAINDGLGEEIA